MNEAYVKVCDNMCSNNTFLRKHGKGLRFGEGQILFKVLEKDHNH